MLKQVGKWVTIPSSYTISPLLSKPNSIYHVGNNAIIFEIFKPLKPDSLQVSRRLVFSARRRVRYEEEEDDDKEEECGHNEEISMLEIYSQSARGEALIVHAVVDEQDVEVLIFKGFSSCLSYETSPDPSRSVLPARAVIKSIDRIKGPFDPSSIEYLEKGLTWDAFKGRVFRM